MKKKFIASIDVDERIRKKVLNLAKKEKVKILFD